MQESAGAKDDAGSPQQGHAGGYGPPGTTYLSESDRKLLQELKAQGPKIAQTEVDLHAINVGAGALSLNALKSVELCADSECQSLSITTRADETITATTDGRALALGKTTLKSGTFTHLKVRLSDADGKDVEKSLKFRDPVPANLLATKVQALLAVGRAPGCEGEDCLQAVSAASVPRLEGAEHVYYNPAAGSARKVKQHLDVNMPPGMLKEAEIFSVMTVDTGGMHPHVEVAPGVNLFSPMKAEVHPYSDGKKRAKSLVQEKSLETPEPRVFEVDNPYEITAGRKTSERLGSGKDIGAKKETAADRVRTCTNRLQGREITDRINSLEHTGGIFHWTDGVCVDVAPYVHIAITHPYRDGGALDVVFDDYSENKDATAEVLQPDGPIERIPYKFGPGVSLRRVEHYSGFDVLINGFLWDGDISFSWDVDPVGRPLGYVKGLDVANDERLVIGRNTDENGASDGLKRVVEILDDPASLVFSTMRTTRYESGERVLATLSSDSSIFVEGECTHEAEYDRRSAVGFTDDGKVVFVSSTTDGSTSNDELCELFKALDVTWAIRMDGGNATSMTVNGNLVNPLGFWGSLAFGGESRRVATAFGYRSELAR